MRDRAAYNAYMAAYMLRRYHRVRAEIVASLGGQCARCAANDNLEIDHADAGQKSFNIAAGWQPMTMRDAGVSLRPSSKNGGTAGGNF